MVPKKISEPLSEKIGTGEKCQNRYRKDLVPEKRSWNRYQENLKPELIFVAKNGIRTGKICYQKKYWHRYQKYWFRYRFKFWIPLHLHTGCNHCQ